MLLNDERILWSSETEELALKLENKSRDEILDILEDGDVIRIRQGDIKSTLMQRISCILTAIPFVIILFGASAIKQLITGDRYLNSWVRKLKMEEFLKKHTIFF